MIKTSSRAVPRAVYAGSFATYKDLPAVSGPEYCVIGRSNVGKSSFFNRIFEEKGLALVSKRPGKTVCANMFNLDTGAIFVDLPGYGFAQRGDAEIDRISALIRDYCERREELQAILWLLDIRHPGAKADLAAFEWLGVIERPIMVVLTKADKVGSNEAAKLVRQFKELYRLHDEPLRFSAERGEYRDRFWDYFETWKSGPGTQPRTIGNQP